MTETVRLSLSLFGRILALALCLLGVYAGAVAVWGGV